MTFLEETIFCDFFVAFDDTMLNMKMLQERRKEIKQVSSFKALQIFFLQNVPIIPPNKFTSKISLVNTAQKMKFSINDFFSKCDRIWSHLLKKSIMENFIFCVVKCEEFTFIHIY